jgi:hypothetical protein
VREEQLGGAHGGERVGDAPTRDVRGAPVNGLEQGVALADVGGRREPQSPDRAAASSERMSPKRLVVTMTSKLSGRSTRFIAQVSTSISSTSRSGNCRASARPTRRNSPQVSRRTLAL